MNRPFAIPALSMLLAASALAADSSDRTPVSSDILNDNQDQSGTPSTYAPPPPPNSVPAYKPYSPALKWKYATRSAFGPFAFVGAGIGGAIAQAENTPSEWGQGGEGYADRFANSFGINLADAYFKATLQTVFREDPRYFPSPDRTTKGRVKYAVKHIFLARKDTGGEGFAFARIGSAFGAGFLANTWNPRSNSSASDALQRAGTILGIDFGLKFAQEFIPVLRRLNP